MLSEAIIEKTLQNDFTASTRRKGFNYYEEDMVIEVEINKEDRSVWAQVHGSADEIYEVRLDIEEDIQEIEGYCDCPVQGYCKHQVAVLYELFDWVNAQTPITPTLPIRRGRRSRPRPADTHYASIRGRGMPPGYVPEKIQAETLEGDRTGQFRKLPLNDRDLSRTLNKFKPSSYQSLGWNESFEGTFISESELELKNTGSDYIYNFNEKKIVLKKEGEELFVKCLSCDKNLSTLCSHQMGLLSKACHVLEQSGFISGDLNYQTIIDKGVKNSGVDRKAFHDYFEIKITPQGFAIQSLKENMVPNSWLKLTQEFIDVDKQNRKNLIQKHTDQLEEGRKRKFAFLWCGIDYDNQGQSIPLSFIKGLGFKTKEGIQGSDRTIDKIPTGFPLAQQELAQQLFFLCQEENPAKRFSLVKELIDGNLEALNEIYQYVFYSDPHYDKPKASQLHLVKFHPTPLECKFAVGKKDGLIEMQRTVTLDGKPFDFSKVVFSNELFSATATTAYFHPNYRFEDFISLFEDSDSLLIPYTNTKDYTKLINGFKQYFEVETEAGLSMDEEILTNPKYQILLREVGSFVLFEPRLKYEDDYSFNAFDEDSYYIDQKVFRVDESDRQFLIEFTKSAHPNFNNDIQVQDYVFLDIKSMVNNYWFAHFNEACESAGIEVLGQNNLSKFKYSKHRASTFSHVKSGIDWFEVNMGISFGSEKVKTADWIRALRNKESFVTLKDGSLGLLPAEWLEQAKKVIAVADVEKGDLKISKYRFNVIEDLFEEMDDKKIIKELKEKKERLANYDTTKKYKVPKIISADLRAYQKDGFAWLKFLDESEFGGILADDMGLGKTLQVISLLADQIKQPPSLVIVPRSLLFNWSAELDKFCAKLKYKIHHGQGRAKVFDDLLPCNIVITTYGTAASDIELLKDFKFNYIVLDESQAIKNPDSKRYKAMRLLQARNKIAMTGTPIENNTFDLYAQLSFTSPGLLGTKSSFKNNFAVPIDNHGDVDAANLLRKLIHPFLLRRTKEQVAKDLPDKTESVIFCEMGTNQRKLYDNLKRQIKEDIEAEVEEKGIAKSKFKMLDGLLRLRQMCNSPLLINDSFTGSNAESVKINILLQNITEELDQHNALIFSQFVSLLSIVRKELDKRGIKYAYLDGSTTKRQEEVEKFMGSDDIKIFLISLKAGNTGLNLTKADYVYILDPWWNPAVEAQAIDRTHRIGQDKQIFAYKLICKDSIEEKILKLQEKKKQLAKDIIRTDENVLKSLNKNELMALFD